MKVCDHSTHTHTHTQRVATTIPTTLCTHPHTVSVNNCGVTMTGFFLGHHRWHNKHNHFGPTRFSERNRKLRYAIFSRHDNFIVGPNIIVRLPELPYIAAQTAADRLNKMSPTVPTGWPYDVHQEVNPLVPNFTTCSSNTPHNYQLMGWPHFASVFCRI